MHLENFHCHFLGRIMNVQSNRLCELCGHTAGDVLRVIAQKSKIFKEDFCLQ